MKFLVYTVDISDDNATLGSFEPGADKDLTRVINWIEDMDLERVLNNDTVKLLVDNIDYDKNAGLVTADVYKEQSHSKALHQLAEDGDGMTIQEIISEHEDAFVNGVFGMTKVDDEVHIILENRFGSYFVSACKDMDPVPQYSSDTIHSIQDSETIGRTTLDFADDFDLTASLLKTPKDEDVRENEGFGKTDITNTLLSAFSISRAHRVSLDIERDEWLNNVEVFDELVESGIVTAVRIEDTKNGVVRLGEGGERAIRHSIETTRSDKRAVKEAFQNLQQ
ncbi:hypothetical protein [Haloparvum sp. PAK95]|uniref:hypothetical protein n=1 Tax=Haloparvum sp. PAK95 TaxID=3418962 RepID=UPI003D2EFBC7